MIIETKSHQIGLEVDRVRELQLNDQYAGSVSGISTCETDSAT